MLEKSNERYWVALLDKFTHVEDLGSSESVFCSKCKSAHSNGTTKKLSFWKLPASHGSGMAVPSGQ